MKLKWKRNLNNNLNANETEEVNVIQTEQQTNETPKKTKCKVQTKQNTNEIQTVTEAQTQTKLKRKWNSKAN